MRPRPLTASRRRSWKLPVGLLRASLLMLPAVLAPASAEVPPTLDGHGGPVRSLGLVDGGTRLVSGGFDSAILVWDLGRGTVGRVLRHHDSAVTALQPLADGCFASAGEDARIAVWCGDGERPVRVITGHTAPIAALAASGDGRTLISAGWDHTVRIWRPLEDEPAPRVIDGHKAAVNSVAVLPGGGAVVSVGYDGRIAIDDIATATVIRARKLDAPLNAVAVAPDGEILAAGADGLIHILAGDLSTRRQIALDRGPLTALALSVDGRRIAAAGLRTPLTLIDRTTGSTIAEIVGPGLPIWSIAFTPDGKTLISGGIDRAIRQWDAASGTVRGAAIAGAEPTAAGSDGERGARLFRACRACHSLSPGDTRLAGPTLAGIFGRRIASAPGYAYSDALSRLDIVWQADTLSRLFEIGPNAYLPGTKMPEQRITSPEDRKALFEWLRRVTE